MRRLVRVDGSSAAAAGRRKPRAVPGVASTRMPCRRRAGDAADVVAVLMRHEDGVDVRGVLPSRARRASTSFSPSPQSIITQRPSASTSAALPRLPLPSQAKRTRRPYLPPGESVPGAYTGIGNCATLPPSAALILLTPCFSTSSTRSTACKGM
jgi:hypothetical protein